MAGMNPKVSPNVITNPLARMLPRHWLQSRVYRMGDAHPPGLVGYSPTWETIPVVLAGLNSAQFRINLKPDFHLLALTGRSSAAGGFRLQIYDIMKQRKLMDRGASHFNLLGTGGQPFYLAEPYRFDQPNSQVLVIIQNLDPAQNTIEAVLYGSSQRWNQ